MKKRTLISWTGIAGLAFVVTFLFTIPFQPAAAEAKSIELSVAMHIPPKAAPYPNAFLPWTKDSFRDSFLAPPR